MRCDGDRLRIGLGSRVGDEVLLRRQSTESNLQSSGGGRWGGETEGRIVLCIRRKSEGGLETLAIQNLTSQQLLPLTKSTKSQFSPNRRKHMSILRRSLSAPLSNGHTSFILPCKKLIFEYCEVWGSNRGMKDFLAQQVTRVAAANPGVECVVRRRPNKHPVLRAVYGKFSLISPPPPLRFVRVIAEVYVAGSTVNGRDKVICVRNLPSQSISAKVQLLLDSSGNKILSLKRPKVESTTESVRGIWSAFHE